MVCISLPRADSEACIAIYEIRSYAHNWQWAGISTRRYGMRSLYGMVVAADWLDSLLLLHLCAGYLIRPNGLSHPPFRLAALINAFYSFR